MFRARHSAECSTLARAFRWKRMLEAGELARVAELAQREGISPSYMTRVLRLTLLAPDIVEAILDGTQGPELTLARLMEPFPVKWRVQTDIGWFSCVSSNSVATGSGSGCLMWGKFAARKAKTLPKKRNFTRRHPMPFIAKTAPITAAAGDDVLIEERTLYGGGEIWVGADVFLWSSESQGGVGLWGKGTVTAVKPGGSKPVVTVHIEKMVNSRGFGLNEIARHRDSAEDTPVVGLARKLYRHAHNKIARISDIEAGLLQRFF